ncbi:MAG: acetate--CoA ligase family protein [Firmicutes bacterium]|nr:acetate--CoA ligase family protein [Bacillota bacterium]
MSGIGGLTRPRSIAVVGASRSPGKVGNAVLVNIIKSGFQGPVYPVNPKEKEIEGLRCFASVADLPEPPETAVFTVPAAAVLEAAESCGKKGVKFLAVLTAGFKELGRGGLEMEKQLAEMCRRYGMRMLGPNCLGFMDTHTPVNATFNSSFPGRGGIAFISQSGAILAALLDRARSSGIGFSKIVSLGNKADLNETDFIEEAAEDPDTRVIMCYLEDVADGERFLETAARAVTKKPLVVFKSGTSQAGALAASSHTGALAGSDRAYAAAFSQCGVIRASSMRELFELAVSFANQPVPRGDRLAIVTNSGGPGIIATDCAEKVQVNIARFSKETIGALREGLPAEAGIYNPVDVLGDAPAARFKYALERVFADDNVDGVLVLLCPTLVTEPEETARAVVEIKESYPAKPVMAAYMGGDSLAGGAAILTAAGVPCFDFPENAVRAFSGLARYARKPGRDGERNGEIRINPDQKTVKAVFYDVKKDNRVVLLSSEACAVVAAYGIEAAPAVLTRTPGEAVAAAGRLGYPVVLKVASPKIMHKTDVGGVRVGLETPQAVRDAFVEIMENVQRYLPEVAPHGIEVQKMMPRGIELIIGMTRDVQFGPLLAFGLGGIYVNLIKDVSFRLARGLTAGEIEKMIAETKAYTLLRGYRGGKPADLAAIAAMIGRIAALVTDFPEITEMDINPVFAYHQGAVALDVKITIS